MTEQVPAPHERLRPDNQLSFVYIAGVTGGGRSLTALRQVPGLSAYSSISSREGLKRGELNLKDHYRQLAHEIISKTGDKDLVLIGHSLGGIEAFDIMEELFKNPDFKSNNLEMIILGTPGFTGDGISGLIDTVRRFSRVKMNWAMHEQHMLYPLPESYYLSQSDKTASSLGINPGFTDSPESRLKRRENFIKNTKPEWLKEKGQTVSGLIDRIELIDNQISAALQVNQPTERLLRERAALIFPVLTAVNVGDDIRSEIHDSSLGQYRELPQDLGTSLNYIINAMRYLGSAGVMIVQGLEKRLKRVLDLAKKSGKKIYTTFLLMGEDEIIRPEDLVTLGQRLAASNIPQNALSLFFMENTAHSTIGYNPEPLTAFLKKLRQRAG